MGFYSGATVVLVTLVLFVPGLDSTSILNMCHAQCRDEEELRLTCKMERNCNFLLPDLDAFVECLEPCIQIGDNCFQRCAFKTDEISATCLRQCNIHHDLGDVRGSAVAQGETSSQSAGTSEQEGNQGTLCYKACYDNLLNDAMNRLYTKRPRLS